MVEKWPLKLKKASRPKTGKDRKKTKWLNFQFEKKLVEELTVEAEEGTKNESKKRGKKKILYNIFEESENLMCQKHLMCQKKC